jgi:hypothetical protein
MNAMAATERLLADLRREEDLQKLLNPLGNVDLMSREYERFVRAAKLNEVSATEKMWRDIERVSVPAKLQLDAEKIRRLIDPRASDVLKGIQAADRQMLEEQRAKLLDPLYPFRSLQLDQIQQKLADPMKGTVAALLERDRLANVDWAQRMADMVSPWARLQAETQSIRALTELASIGSALKTFHPFAASFTAALRTDFGDWRNAPDPSAAVLVDIQARTSYYVKQGFDPTLTDFDEPAFAEGLDASELCENYLEDDDLDQFVPPTSTAEEAAAFRRANKCHEFLHAMEFKLRRFIHSKMVAQYGENWSQQRVGKELLESWEQKAEKARVEGRPFQLLIEAADFTEYEAILVKKDHFRLMFEPHFQQASSVQESFRRLRPLRLDAMHGRPVSKEDLLMAIAECMRILRAIETNQ